MFRWVCRAVEIPADPQAAWGRVLARHVDDKGRVAYVNRYRDEPIAADYAIEFIPYDWSLNRQP